MNNLSQYIFLISGLIIGVFFGYIVGKTIKHLELKKQRGLSVKKSREVILGEVYEKVAPMLENFPYNHKDLTFVGRGIDYIVFDGLAEGNLKNIVFLEIKSGKSTLNKNERDIRDIVEKGKVSYEIYKI
ncbi:MAG: Holliday junction resolvase-like protein [Candidatus Gracilibacteria bacterium]|nr:Holliday junction resolvase-like protein [Candidatus Gracilibacteria bacterium]